MALGGIPAIQIQLAPHPPTTLYYPTSYRLVTAAVPASNKWRIRMSDSFQRRSLAVLSCCLSIAVFATAQDPGSPSSESDSPRGQAGLTALPSSPDAWLNSAPLSLENLEGKALVLYYFEETCPSCRKRWPALLETANSLKDNPVVFVGVNSGNAPQAVRSYLQQNKIDWPVIVDQERTFEDKTINTEISLQNIYQTRLVTVAGDWRAADSNKIEVAAREAAEGGSWKVEPDGIPDELRSAWRDVEIGNFAPASRAIMRAGRGSDASAKQAAKELFQVVQSSMDAELARIGELLKAGNNWAAYQALSNFMATYDGYPMHPAVAEKYDEVRKQDEVAAQLQASKKLAAAIRTGSAGSPAAVKRATGMLKRIVSESPDTEAAAQARAMLDKLGENSSTPEDDS